MNLTWWLNSAWMCRCRGQWRRFQQASGSVQHAQETVLREILTHNATTRFGTAHALARLRTPRDFQRAVPLSTYETCAAWIDRIATGEPNVLTRDRVGLFEPTSGTSGGEKLIPYTASLRRQFQRGIAAWIFDLLRHKPAVRSGRAYWSISPAFGPPRRTAGGIPIGFEDDRAYLAGLERLAVGRLLAVPPSVTRIAGIEQFRYATLFHLLNAADLTLVSIWSPTFLPAILERLPEWHDQLCCDLERGRISPAGERGSGPNPQRAEHLRKIFRSRMSWPERLALVWPRLALISCWADAAAAQMLPQLRQWFPTVEIQPKGLLATEAFVSFPLVGREGAALAVRSHFFEFQPASDDGSVAAECLLAHQLERGGRYRVVVTTGGGLYRYQLRDEVEVVGFEAQCPLLRFLGKADLVSDLVGEKLGEDHVRRALDRLLPDHGLTPDFLLLVPVEGRPPCYRLYLQGRQFTGPAYSLEALQSALQVALEANPYYRHATQLGQLGNVQVRLLDPSGESGRITFERRCLASGQKLGNIKPAMLDRRPGWAEWFERSSHEGASHHGRCEHAQVPRVRQTEVGP
jgi:hypothetical protein